MAEVAPMLSVLGYDPNANPPDYGKPDSFVQSKMQDIIKHREVWEEKEREAIKLRESLRGSLIQDNNKVYENTNVKGAGYNPSPDQRDNEVFLPGEASGGESGKSSAETT